MKNFSEKEEERVERTRNIIVIALNEHDKQAKLYEHHLNWLSKFLDKKINPFFRKYALPVKVHFHSSEISVFRDDYYIGFRIDVVADKAHPDPTCSRAYLFALAKQVWEILACRDYEKNGIHHSVYVGGDDEIARGAIYNAKIPF